MVLLRHSVYVRRGKARLLALQSSRASLLGMCQPLRIKLSSAQNLEAFSVTSASQVQCLQATRLGGTNEMKEVTVLVAEDEPALRELCSAFLESVGYRVETA